MIGGSRPSKNWRRSDRWTQNTGNIKNLRPVPLSAIPGFDILSAFLGLARKTGIRLVIILVGAGDAAGQRTPAAQPTWTPWAPPTPLGRHSWWGRCLGPANSPTILSRICWIGFNSPERREGRSLRSLVPGEGSTPSLVTSTPGWTQPRCWSAFP